MTTWPWAALIAAVSAALIVLLAQLLLTYRLRREELSLNRARLRYEFEFVEVRKPDSKRSDDELLQLIYQQGKALERIQTPHIYIDSSRRLDRIEESDKSRSEVGLDAVVREIGHSLNTPISQIDIAVQALVDRAVVTGDQEVLRQAQKIATSVEVCKAFLWAFRDLAQVADTLGSWQVRSLDRSISAAAELYADARHDSRVGFFCSLPESIPGYSNSFVAALLLPIVENAIEACPVEGSVSVSSRTSEELTTLVVENDCEDVEVEVDRMFEPGFSSKEGHQGLGLSVAMRLASTRRGVSIDSALSEARMRFTISLPIGKRDGR